MYQGKYVSGEPKAPRKRRRQKNSRKGTVLFYSIYGAVTAVLLIAIFCALSPLKQWLIKFEASQPKQKCDEVFQELFEQPDWEEIYTLAGVEDTLYEGKEAYAAYMNDLVGDKKLNYIETSAGLSGDRKYIVRLGENKIATFTLTGGADEEIAIPEWQLGEVEVFFTRAKSAVIAKLPGQTVCINGVDLDETFTIRTVTTLAENYLPEGLHGYRLVQQRIEGLLTEPTVTVRNEDGSFAKVIRDAETGIYHVEAAVPPEISQEETALATNAAETYAKYMIRATSLSTLGKLFDVTSDIYKTIQKDESIVQSYAKYSLEGLEVTDYYRYSDSLFSVRVQLTVKITRTNGTVKDYPINSTYFFTKNHAGTWLVTDMINVNVQEQIEKIRLVFMNGDMMVSSMLVDVSPGKLTIQVLAVPEGKVFSGWVKETIGEDGKTTLTVMFTPDENGVVYLPEDTRLEPMVLYALFESAGGGK